MVCGKAHFQCLPIFSSYQGGECLMLSRFWSRAQTKSRELSFLLSPCWTWTLSVIYLPHQCKHCRPCEMKELQKSAHLLLALRIPSFSTEQNHTLALCRLHTKKSLVRGEKKISYNHHERGKLLDGVFVLIHSAKVNFLPWTSQSTGRSNSFSFSGPRSLLIFFSCFNNFGLDMSKLHQSFLPDCYLAA